VVGGGLSAPDLSGAFEVRYGIPQPKWTQICDALGDDPQEWRPFLRDWTNRVAAALGSSALVYNTQRAIVVTDVEEHDAHRAVRIIERAVGAIEDACLSPDHSDRAWPRLFFIMNSRERYYDFAAGGTEAGEAAFLDTLAPADTDDLESEIASAGMCFRAGYIHILIEYQRDDYFPHVIAHEFTHAVNTTRELPLWLDEGLAEVLAARFMYGGQYKDRFILDRLLWKDMAECWKRNGFEELWAGTAFTNLELSHPAYNLVPLLTINLIERCGEKQFFDFLDHVNHEDHGETAVKQLVGLSLDDFAHSVLC